MSEFATKETFRILATIGSTVWLKAKVMIGLILFIWLIVWVFVIGLHYGFCNYIVGLKTYKTMMVVDLV